jgi:radical SAM superfamily enzyme YgiQ (UPF0313 family)
LYLKIMRVLLISANTEKLPDPVAPLGLALLCAALKSKGYRVECLDLCFLEDPLAAVRKVVRELRPEAIGLSLRNVDNVAYPQTVSYLPFYKEVIAACRQVSPAPLFLGGAGFTLMPGAILDYLGADMGIVGEGEEAFPQALRALSLGLPAAPEGMIRRGSKQPRPPACIRDLDSLPAPDWDSLDLAGYFRQGGMGNLQTKRGCPFHCIYCTYPLIEGRTVRLRSPAKVADEAEGLAQRGVAHAFVVDNIFNFPESHAREVCRGFRERKIALQWSCFGHPAYLTAPLAAEMKAAGCTGVEFGCDSGAAAVLDLLGKDFTPEHIRGACRLAREAGLEVCLSLSLGAPGETAATLQETFRLVEEISPTAVIAMVGLRIFPGTGLARLARAEGLLSPGHDFLPPAFYLAPAVKDWIVDWVRREAGSHPHWIFPGLGINLSPRLQGALRRIGVKGPLWENLKSLRSRRVPEGEPRA